MTPVEAMERAIELAARGLHSTHPNPRVGCVVLKDGENVGEGWHQRAGTPHAEVHALRAAGERARGAQVFVSLEPCAHHGRTPPCVDALIAAGVSKVFAAILDPDPRVCGRGLLGLQAAGIEVDTGLCAEPARELNRGFISRLTRGRPWTCIKIAASLDGRTAAANGQSRWITGAEARIEVHRLRAEAGAVMVGADTVLVDDPSLTVRDWQPAQTSLLNPPDRIVLDPRGRVQAAARVWNNDGARRFWIVSEALAVAAPAGVQVLPVAVDAAGRIQLVEALAELGRQEINELLIEAGPRLAGALLQAQQVDELLVYMAPRLLGDAAQPLAVLLGLNALDDAIEFEWIAAERIGRDLKLRLRRRRLA